MFILTWLLKIYKNFVNIYKKITNVIENENCIKKKFNDYFDLRALYEFKEICDEDG
jgi:hypothetical protein